MESINHFKNLFEYNDWANQESLASLKTTKNADEKAESILSHIVISQILWLSRVSDQEFKFNSFWETLTHQQIKILSKKNTDDWLNFIKGKDQKDFEEFCSYTTSEGEKFNNKLKDILLHVVNHSTYHRGQVAVLVRKAGGVPAMTDYIHYKRKISKKNI